MADHTKVVDMSHGLEWKFENKHANENKVLLLINWIFNNLITKFIFYVFVELPLSQINLLGL